MLLNVWEAHLGQRDESWRCLLVFHYSNEYPKWINSTWLSLKNNRENFPKKWDFNEIVFFWNNSARCIHRHSDPARETCMLIPFWTGWSFSYVFLSDNFRSLLDSWSWQVAYCSSYSRIGLIFGQVALAADRKLHAAE